MSERRDGFGVVTRDVGLDPTISGSAKNVYLVLALHRDFETSEAYPSVGLIATALGVSTRTVQRGLDELEEHGVIRKQARFRGGRQTSNRYVLQDAIARRPGGRLRLVEEEEG